MDDKEHEERADLAARYTVLFGAHLGGSLYIDGKRLTAEERALKLKFKNRYVYGHYNAVAKPLTAQEKARVSTSAVDAEEKRHNTRAAQHYTSPQVRVDFSHMKRFAHLLKGYMDWNNERANGLYEGRMLA